MAEDKKDDKGEETQDGEDQKEEEKKPTTCDQIKKCIIFTVKVHFFLSI